MTQNLRRTVEIYHRARNIRLSKCVEGACQAASMKHYRIHIDIQKFEQIYLHRHRYDMNAFEYCLN